MLNTYRLAANRAVQLVASADADSQLVNMDTVANVYVSESPNVSALAGYPIPPLSAAGIAAGTAVWVVADAACTVVLSDTVSGYDNPTALASQVAKQITAGTLASDIANQVATKVLAVSAPGALPVTPSGGSLPVTPSGGSLPVTPSGGSLPVTVPAGSSLPVTASGGSLPVTASGGSLPVTASGGSLPVTASGGALPVTPSGATLPVSAPNGLPILDSTITLVNNVLLASGGQAAGYVYKNFPGAATFYDVSQYSTVVLNVNIPAFNITQTDNIPGSSVPGDIGVLVQWFDVNGNLLVEERFHAIYLDPAMFVCPVKGPQLRVSVVVGPTWNTVGVGNTASLTVTAQTQSIPQQSIRRTIRAAMASTNVAAGAQLNCVMSCIDGKVRLHIPSAGTTAMLLILYMRYLDAGDQTLQEAVAWQGNPSTTVSTELEIDMPRGVSLRLNWTNNDTVSRIPTASMIHVGRS